MFTSYVCVEIITNNGLYVSLHNYVEKLYLSVLALTILAHSYFIYINGNLLYVYL
jgi:hypothetical protein